MLFSLIIGLAGLSVLAVQQEKRCVETPVIL
jgi:hypothetical protein